jgi:AcrR family transcriptional regulator
MSSAEVLLHALDELAREKGLRNVALREVARRAGLSHAAPAHFFGSMAGMLEAFALEGLRILDAEVCAPERFAGLHGVERLVADSMAFIAFAVNHPAHFDAIFRAGVPEDGQLAEQRQMALDALRTLVKEAMAEGAIRTADPELVTMELWAGAHGLASLWVDGLLPHIAGGDPATLAERTVRTHIDRLR